MLWDLLFVCFFFFFFMLYNIFVFYRSKKKNIHIKPKSYKLEILRELIAVTDPENIVGGQNIFLTGIIAQWLGNLFPTSSSGDQFPS